MDVLRITNQLNSIRTAALSAALAINNGDSTGVRREMAEIEKSIAAINNELDGAIFDGVKPDEDVDMMSDAEGWKKPRA